MEFSSSWWNIYNIYNILNLELYIYNILNLEFDFRRIRNSMQNALSLENNPINFSRQLRNIFDTILNDRAAKRK